MNNVQIRGLMKAHNKNRRSANERNVSSHTCVTVHTVAS